MNTSSPDAAAAAVHWRLLALAALLPLAATILLFKLDIPLGKPGSFVYLYSPAEVVPRRLAALPAAFALALLLGWGTWLAFSERKWRRRAGLILLWLGCIAGAGWAYVAPPQFRSQHLFNMQSPSHDGAFLTEAAHVRRAGVKNYLRGFPERAAMPPEEMRGTRVISNPPAATLLAVGTTGLMERSALLRRWLLKLGADESLPPEMNRLVAASTGFALALWLLWLLAALPLYGVGRVFFSPPTAAVFMVVCLLSPMTLLLAPGKDPAQLLTVALPLWLWLRAWRRWVPHPSRVGDGFEGRSVFGMLFSPPSWEDGAPAWIAALAGGVSVLACLVSPVHVWIAAVVFAAGALNAPARQWRGFALRVCLPAVSGALVAVIALALLADLNFIACVRAAAGAQTEITRGNNAMPFLWQTLGLPLFVLFAGPALWYVGLWLPRRSLHDRAARFGLHVFLGAAAIMGATVGFTNVETPRLWIPFAPLLLLGASLQLTIFRRPGKQAALVLAALVFTQIGASAVQWALIDVREAETRLLQPAGAGPRFFE